MLRFLFQVIEQPNSSRHQLRYNYSVLTSVVKRELNLVGIQISNPFLSLHLVSHWCVLSWISEVAATTF